MRPLVRPRPGGSLCAYGAPESSPSARQAQHGERDDELGMAVILRVIARVGDARNKYVERQEGEPARQEREKETAAFGPPGSHKPHLTGVTTLVPEL